MQEHKKNKNKGVHETREQQADRARVHDRWQGFVLRWVAYLLEYLTYVVEEELKER